MDTLCDSTVQPSRSDPLSQTRFEQVTARWVNPLEDAAWNASCQAHPEACFFHSTEWLRVLVETYGFEPLGYLVKVGEAPAAMIPMLEVKHLFRPPKGVCLPFTDFCDPLLW